MALKAESNLLSSLSQLNFNHPLASLSTTPQRPTHITMSAIADLGNLATAVEASLSALDPIVKHADEDLSDGLSLLLVRPQILLDSLQQLTLSLALRLLGQTDTTPVVHSGPSRLLDDHSTIANELHGQLVVDQEILEKVRGMESKLEYQIKKLTALAEVKPRQEEDDDVEDPMAFRPNPKAMVQATETESRRRPTTEGDEGVYRPPRVAAMPYNEKPVSSRKERQAPALLSEFASTLEGAPGMETTSGLSTLPLRRHTNSASAKRAAELKRINEFEEENMTRLVTTKREGKRRREDEAALAMGYGVGGTGRNRGNRQNGLEAELEGVLGDRRSKGIWDLKVGQRDGMFERGKKGVAAADGAKPGKRPKKTKFEKGR